MPSTQPYRFAGLECWLTGTADELDAARAALAGGLRVVYASVPARLHGADAGRFRLYLRLSAAAPTYRRRDVRTSRRRDVHAPALTLVPQGS